MQNCISTCTIPFAALTAEQKNYVPLTSSGTRQKEKELRTLIERQSNKSFRVFKEELTYVQPIPLSSYDLHMNVRKRRMQ